MGSEHGGDDGEETNGGGLDVNAEPAMSLAIESQDILQLTVTKTGLDVFKKLGAVSQTLNPFSSSQFIST